MKLISIADIKGPTLYEGMRNDFRQHVINLKRPRRITLGDEPTVTLVFENRHTLIFQIEEMLRTERITQADKIQEEIDVYNELMPTANSISATLFIEVPPAADARTELDRLIGLDEHVILHIGDHALRAEFEQGRGSHERISAVQYVRFPLTSEAKTQLLTSGTALRIEIDHPNYAHAITCAPSLRESLASDFQ